MVGKYETKVDLKNRNSSQSLIVQLTGNGKRVLDVGTATGYVAEALVRRDCQVTGIEINPEAAKQAEEHCEKVIVEDIENIDVEKEFDEGFFDVIVFGDVLEHLKDPQQILERFRPLLTPNGYVVASIPNVAHGSVRLALMQGNFQYRPVGLLDNTHLRFFTRDTVELLFNDAGYAIDLLERTKLGLFDTEIDVEKDLVPKEVLHLIRNDPESRTYQFVLRAYPYDGTLIREKFTDRTQFLREQLGHRDRLIHELNRRIRNLDQLQLRLEERDKQLMEKNQEVSKLSQELTDRNHQLARLERTVKRLNRRLKQPGKTVG